MILARPSWYSGGARSMREFWRHTGTMRTFETRLKEPEVSVGGRARCHQNWTVPVVLCWLLLVVPLLVVVELVVLVEKGEALEESVERPCAARLIWASVPSWARMALSCSASSSAWACLSS